jgi:hypothetical protein
MPMTAPSPAARRALATVRQIERMQREPLLSARSPAWPGSGSARNYSFGRRLPFDALLEEPRECGLLLADEVAR